MSLTSHQSKKGRARIAKLQSRVSALLLTISNSKTVRNSVSLTVFNEIFLFQITETERVADAFIDAFFNNFVYTFLNQILEVNWQFC